MSLTFFFLSLTFKDSHINWYSSLPGQYEDLRSVQFQLFPLDLYAVVMYCLYFVLSHYCYYLLSVFTIGNISMSFTLNFLVRLQPSIWYHSSFVQRIPFNAFFTAQLLLMGSFGFV